MPELPEVETVRRDLAQTVVGRTIARLDALHPGSIRSPSLRRFTSGVTGRTIVEAGRRGKHLILHLDSGDCLVVHLRMTGVLQHQGKNDSLPGMARIIFSFSDGTRLAFSDQRKFGHLSLARDPMTLPGISELGPEPLSDSFTAALLGDRLAGKNGPIKTVLLDQRVIAGLGNIYVLEALHRAGISPLRRAGALSAAEVARLHRAIVAVLRAAIAARGSSVNTYRDGRGKRGWFQVHHRVYDREGRTCRRCGGTIVKQQFRGRGTYWCPGCQK